MERGQRDPVCLQPYRWFVMWWWDDAECNKSWRKCDLNRFPTENFLGWGCMDGETSKLSNLEDRIKNFYFWPGPSLCWRVIFYLCVLRGWIHVPLGDENALFRVNIEWVFCAAPLSFNLPPRALHTDRRLSAQIHARTCRFSVCFQVWAVICTRLPW